MRHSADPMDRGRPQAGQERPATELFDIRRAGQVGGMVRMSLTGVLGDRQRRDGTLLLALNELFLDGEVRTVRLDLSELRHIDLEGVAALIAAVRRGEELGTACSVEGAAGQVLQRLTDVGLLGYLSRPSG
jgi:ABC-type transporter Mla MlaB component